MYESAINANRKQQNASINRLKYRGGPKMFDYLEDFKNER